MDLLPTRLDIYRTSIPMRSFEHAAASRHTAEAIVTRVTFADGSIGWGETLPRDYVTGETFDSVVGDLQEFLWPSCAGRTFADMDSLATIPVERDGRTIPAARCAMELSLAGRLSAGTHGRIAARVSGVLGSSDPAKTARRLRLMRWFGLRDFKLKLGFGEDVDAENLGLVHRRLGRGIARGRFSLRVDVNGGWTAAEVPDRVAALHDYGVCVVEQPVYCVAGEFLELARRCALPLMADESLITLADAETLSAVPQRVWWNVRLSKNGGLTGATALLNLAAQCGVTVSFGCMVGESGILSAAQRRTLQTVPTPRFVEGNYGTFLLSDDLTHPSPRFGYGGRLRPLCGGDGFGIHIDPEKVERFSQHVASCTQ